MLRNGKHGIYIDQETEVCLGVYRGVQEEMGRCSDVQGDSDRLQGQIMWRHVQVGGGAEGQGIYIKRQRAI